MGMCDCFRWDLQRLREQSLYEKLQKGRRYADSVMTKSKCGRTRSQNEAGLGIISFYPDPDEGKIRDLGIISFYRDPDEGKIRDLGITSFYPEPDEDKIRDLGIISYWDPDEGKIRDLVSSPSTHTLMKVR